MGREGGERDIYVPVSFGRLSGGSFSEERGASSSGGVSAEGAIVAVMFVERREESARKCEVCLSQAADTHSGPSSLEFQLYLCCLVARSASPDRWNFRAMTRANEAR